MQLLVIAWVSAAGAMDCGTSGQLDALRGGGTALDQARLVPPVSLHPPEFGPAPPDRTIYGTPSTWHVETEHFTVNWWDDSVTDAQVTAAAEALEAGWTAFIEEQEWQAPASSDAHYIWVFLDPSLGSTTGYTTEWWDDTYPDGIPLVYINPTTLDDFGAAFYHSLTVHELMHAIQFGMRPYDWDTDPGHNLENWYWEASATHASELADPTVDGHQYTSAWYAEQADLRYDSYEGSHQYGMFVFNAWLEDAVGTHSMRRAWEWSSSRPGVSWRTILTESTGVEAALLWAGFTDAYGNEALPESSLYTAIAIKDTLSDGAGGRLDELATHYWTIDADKVVTPDTTNVILGGTDEPGTALRTGGARVVSVTALRDDTSYTLTVSEPGEDPGEEADAGGDSETEDSGTPATSGGVSDPADKSGCTVVSAGAGAAAWWAVLVVGARRRRPTGRAPRQ